MARHILTPGEIVRLTYKGEVRNVRIEDEPVTEPQSGLPYVKVFDLDKQGYRTFSLCEIRLPSHFQAKVIGG